MPELVGKLDAGRLNLSSHHRKIQLGYSNSLAPPVCLKSSVWLEIELDSPSFASSDESLQYKILISLRPSNSTFVQSGICFVNVLFVIVSPFNYTLTHGQDTSKGRISPVFGAYFSCKISFSSNSFKLFEPPNFRLILKSCSPDFDNSFFFIIHLFVLQSIH